MKSPLARAFFRRQLKMAPTGKDKRKKRRQETYAPDNPAQSRKFLEAAKKLGVDQDSKAFEEAFRNLTGKRRKDGGS